MGYFFGKCSRLRWDYDVVKRKNVAMELCLTELNIAFRELSFGVVVQVSWRGVAEAHS